MTSNDHKALVRRFWEEVFNQQRLERGSPGCPTCSGPFTATGTPIHYLHGLFVLGEARCLCLF